eukprot:m.84899 g.84899  ORF g.84899 m.84899 type:complete len:329 (-) comp11334_c0_seq1:1072-2058(-)
MGGSARPHWLGAGLWTDTATHPQPTSPRRKGTSTASRRLLGRVAGLAVMHKEVIGIQLTPTFGKALLKQPIVPDDLECLDPELYENQVVALELSTAEELENLELTFEVDGSIDAKGVRQTIELKDGGADTCVTVDNLEEYLELVAKHRVVGAIEPQLAAFRNGFAVVVSADLQDILARCLTSSDFVRLLCGTPEICVDEWAAETCYRRGLNSESNVVLWFWEIVGGMTQQERAAVLRFCTGSSRPPSLGFKALMGYNGDPHPFTIERTYDSAAQLPTAITCFNTLRVPRYTSRSVLEKKLRQAIACDTFNETAIDTVFPQSAWFATGS